MELEGSKKVPWHVVVLGRWNSAILSPHGISKRLFAVPEQQEFQLLVAVDGISPMRVGYKGILVSVSPDRLIVESERPEYEGLSRAMEVAKRAIGELPQTPMTAAGFNIQLSAVTDFQRIGSLFDDKWSEKLSDEGFPIVERSISRAIKWLDGEITVAVHQKAQENFEIQINFNRTSADAPELQKWLSTPIEGVRKQAEALLSIIAD